MSKVGKLPLGLFGLEDIPAIPLWISQIPGTLLGLGLREAGTKQATEGLSNVYTIGGITAPAYPFLFGPSDSSSGSDSDSDSDSDSGSVIGNILKKGLDVVEDVVDAVEDHFDGDESDATDTAPPDRADFSAADRARLMEMTRDCDDDELAKYFEEKVADHEPRPLTPAPETSSMTQLWLDHPEQFSLSWTTFADIYQKYLPDLEKWATTLTDVEEANRQFWPTIAEHGLGYNLLFLKKLGPDNVEHVKERFGDAWSGAMDQLVQKGLLYLIDLGIFESLEVQEADGAERFTPATLTLLRQHPVTKELVPIAVRVSGYEGGGAQCYVSGRASDSAWLYALQAAKASVTVYGIWLGHVYHWHVVTGAMQMTMYNTFSEDSPLYKLLEPQSKYLIGFDDVLLLLWESLAPPTSVTSGWQFLSLCNTFAKGRTYFDDDPTTALRNLGLREEDFTVDEPWDRYPLVRWLLRIWELVEEYVTVFVETHFADDAAVAADQELQEWIEASSAKDGGNVRGLPTMDSRAALIRVLTSLIFRVTAHGNSRLLPSIGSAQLFVANYPPCLQKSEIPEPLAEIDTRELLRFLPQTGTIGKTVTFYFIFTWSAPYESFVPPDGAQTNLFFDGGLKNPSNRALVALREGILEFMKDYEEGQPQVRQWPLNVET